MAFSGPPTQPYSLTWYKDGTLGSMMVRSVLNNLAIYLEYWFTFSFQYLSKFFVCKWTLRFTLPAIIRKNPNSVYLVHLLSYIQKILLWHLRGKNKFYSGLWLQKGFGHIVQFVFPSDQCLVNPLSAVL